MFMESEIKQKICQLEATGFNTDTLTGAAWLLSLQNPDPHSLNQIGPSEIAPSWCLGTE